MTTHIRALIDNNNAARLAEAEQTLTKIASEQGVDLDTLPSAEIENMLLRLMGEVPSTKIASEESDHTMTVSAAQVSLELTKLAASEGLDLSALNADEYATLFEKVAADLSDPEYAEKVAQIRHMEELGAVAARGFAAELNKLAAAAEDDEEDEDDENEKQAGVRDALQGAKNLLTRGAQGTKNMANRGVARVGTALRPSSNSGGMMGEKGRAAKAYEKAYNAASDAPGKVKELAKKPGVAAGGAALLGLGLGGAAGHAVGSRKKEAAALELAQEILRQNGIDPATGEKLASELSPVEQRAYELLAEAGYIG